jgi:hypothetical protein
MSQVLLRHVSEVFTQDLEDTGDTDEGSDRADTSSGAKGSQAPGNGPGAQTPANGKGTPSTRPDSGTSQRPPAASGSAPKASSAKATGTSAANKPSTPPPATSADTSTASSSGRVSATDVQDLEGLIRDLKLDAAWVKQRLAEATGGRVKEFSELSPTLYRKLVDKLEEWAERAAIQGEGHAGG